MDSRVGHAIDDNRMGRRCLEKITMDRAGKRSFALHSRNSPSRRQRSSPTELREILLLNHVIRPKSGWGLPGGFLEHGEQADEGIRREVNEETGIKMNNLQMFRVRTLGTHMEILFTADTTGQPEVKSREIKELAWFASDSLPEKMNPAEKALIKKVLAEQV